MSKILPRGDNHPNEVFIGVYVSEATARALQKEAKADGRSVSSLLRKILSRGDNHPKGKKNIRRKNF